MDQYLGQLKPVTGGDLRDVVTVARMGLKKRNVQLELDTCERQMAEALRGEQGNRLLTCPTSDL